MSLVLNWGDGVLGSPVDGSGVGGFVKVDGVEFSGNWHVTVEFFHLGESFVGEEVVSNSVGVVGVSVEGLDLVVSGNELFLSEHEFSDGSVGFTVFRDVGHEFVVLSGESIVSEKFDTGWCFVHEGGTGKGGGGSETSDDCFMLWHL